MATIFRLQQGGSTLVDLMDTTKYRVASWTPAFGRGKWIEEGMTLHILGASADGLHDNFVLLYRALLAAEANAAVEREGGSYTPVYLQYQLNGATSLVQSEVAGGNPEAIQSYFSGLLQRNAVREVPIVLRRRAYFEEASAQALVSSSAINNNGSGVSLSGVRGDLPAPLYVKARTSIANQDRLIAGIKWRGTVANFVCKYEAEGYSARGANVADLAGGATFSGAGTNAQRWTPSGATTLQRLLLWNLTTNVVDQIGTYGVYARVKDNKPTPNKVRLRARGAIYDGTNYTFGDYADYAKACVTANGTLELVYCGAVTFPSVEMGSSTPNGFALELLGEADSGATTLDLDCVYLMPLERPAVGAALNGAGVVTMSKDAGTGALPDMVLDANDRVPRGYLETTGGAVLAPANDVRGGGIFILPNTTAKLFVLTQDAGNGAHDYTATNTVTVTAMPRYAIARGS